MITVVVGPPCSGKSTFVHDSAALGDVIVDFDVLAAAFGSPDAHDAPAAIKKVAHAAREAAIGSVLAGVDADAWIIHSQPKAEWMNRYAAAGAVINTIDPGRDVCLQRAADDGRPEWTADAIERWYAATTESEALMPKTRPDVGVKTCTVKIKTDGLADGEFTGYASVFNNKDSYGDVVVKGAFSNTLGDWHRKGVPIPLLWGHNTADPDFNLGEILDASEDEHGLRVHARLDMESPKAAQTYRLLKSGRVNQMSFAYSVKDGAMVTRKDGDGDDEAPTGSFYELRELDLYEVSIVPIAANQDAEILAVKAAAGSLLSKAGRMLSSKNETAIRGVVTTLEDAATALKSVLPEDDSADEEDQDSTSGEEPSADDAKSSAVTTPSPSVALALAMIDIESYGVAI